MVAQAFVPPQFARAAPLESMNEDVLATAFLPTANSSLLPDPAFVVLVRTATDWFAPALVSEIYVSAKYGRIRMAGHAGNASPLKSLRRALLRLPGIGGLDMTVTVEVLTNPLGTYPAAQHSQHVG